MTRACRKRFYGRRLFTSSLSAMRILGVSLVTTTCLICGALLSTAAYAAGQPVEQIALC
jgi:hypothetical protein